MPEDLKDIEASILAGQKDGAEHSEKPEPEAAPPTPDVTVDPEVVKLRAALASKESELASFSRQVAQRNIEFDKKLAELKEREDEMSQTLAELRDSANPPATQMSTVDVKRQKHEEIINTPEYADYMIWMHAAKRKERDEPGFQAKVIAEVRAEEQRAGMLTGFTIHPVPSEGAN